MRNASSMGRSEMVFAWLLLAMVLVGVFVSMMLVQRLLLLSLVSGVVG